MGEIDSRCSPRMYLELRQGVVTNNVIDRGRGCDIESGIRSGKILESLL